MNRVSFPHDFQADVPLRFLRRAADVGCQYDVREILERRFEQLAFQYNTRIPNDSASTEVRREMLAGSGCYARREAPEARLG